MSAVAGTAELVRVGIDTGGTFTDFVALVEGELVTAKVLSTPEDPSKAIIEGLALLGLENAAVDLVHGTTVGTNAVLEDKGAKVAFVTSTGFADLLELARQNRDSLYDLDQPPVPPPVPAELCREIDARAAADGSVLAEPDDDELAALGDWIASSPVEAVAVNLLFSWQRPELERRVAAIVPEGMPVSLSSQVLPEIREYERGIATWLNAAIGPRLAGYLDRLQRSLAGGRLAVMQSSGLTVSAAQARERAVHLLLSGPAGGLAGASQVGRELGRERLLTFDMGGTSTDVALLEGRPTLTRDGRIGRYPVTVPMVDMHTIGAGGGSIVRLDAGGLLQVGPESAGADPGPVCYGRGGKQVTVTDANLILGRLPRDTRLGGKHALDFDAAAAAMDELAQRAGLDRESTAAGILGIANEHMSRALRVMSAERGIDPRGATLMSFGGAGGLHVCELAESLGMTEAVVPARSGVLSALGMLVAEPGRQATASHLRRLDSVDPAELDSGFEPLVAQVRGELDDEGLAENQLTVERWVDCRYVGQSATLELSLDDPGALIAAFHVAHERAFGHRLELPVELVGLRVEARGPARISSVPGLRAVPGSRPSRSADGVALWPRAAIGNRTVEGPAVIIDEDATIWVAPDWRADLHRSGHLRLGRVA